MAVTNYQEEIQDLLHDVFGNLDVETEWRTKMKKGYTRRGSMLPLVLLRSKMVKEKRVSISSFLNSISSFFGISQSNTSEIMNASRMPPTKKDE